MPKDKPERVSPLDRAIEQAMGEGREVGNPDDPAIVRWPQLWRWMTTIYVGRDNLKTPATLTVKAAPGCITVTLTDRDLGVSVDAASATLEGVFDALEAALTSDTPQIRSWSNKEPTLRKRRQRG